MTTFIGRKAELKALEAQYRSTTGAFVPIYGRRRVGKSELILQFIRKKPAIYFVGKQAPPQLQIREFLREAADKLNEPLLAQSNIDDWKQALRAVAERYSGERKLVLVLDEFQWIAGASPEMPSVLQELWDTHWRDANNIMLILCGSFVGFMERAVLGRKSPLFGRRTAQILLRPFLYREVADFYPSWKATEIARAYFVCGGVPLYLKLFDPKASVEQHIVTKIMHELGPLHREPDFLLREELRDVDSYYGVLTSIASGNSTIRDIATRSAVPEKSLHYYLRQLSDLGYITRRTPLTGASKSKRIVRFVLEDPLLRFWFRFVFPNQSFIQHAGPERAFRERVKPELDAYYGIGFERLCRQALPYLYDSEGVTCSYEIGEYWDKRVQIDIVGVRGDGWIDLGECKWGTVKSARALPEELDNRVKLFPNPKGATIQRRFFVRKRPSGAPGSGSWHTLEDLYEC